MNIFFKDGELSHAKALKNVKSYYFQPKKEKIDLAINNMTGEELILFLNDKSQVETIQVRQNIAGKYKFELK